MSDGVGTWNYNFTTSGNITTATITDPNGHVRTVTSDNTIQQITADQDPLGRTTTYSYDSLGRLLQITYPEGNAEQYAYDSRGNVTSVTNLPKAGSGLSSVVTGSASFDPTCANPVKCNEPNATFDALNNETDYTYDPVHGGVTSITLPAPVAGGVRPQIRYTYQQYSAYYWQKNGSGTVVMAAGPPIWRLHQISQCATTSSCAGTSDEVLTTFAYGAANTPNNLLPTSVTRGSGDGVLAATTTFSYDAFGNRTAVAGPLGAATAVTYRYDAARELVGVVGPDPDGSGGPLKNRAVRVTYNGDGLPTLVEKGYVASQADSDWSGFTSLQQAATVYDAADRKVQASTSAGGMTYSASQFAYDAANRLTCQAIRMNPSAFAALPASACTAGTPGGFGPDRIVSFAYDNADELTSVTGAAGAAGQRTEVSYAYNANGTVKTAADGNGNLTTYTYDGFDRLVKTAYPDPSNGSNSSTIDYEQLTYDAGSRVAQDRRRDGQVVNLTYDQLNRITGVSAPGTSYGYDNLGRKTSATYNNQTVSSTFDALGRMTGQTSPMGTVSYAYDLGDERTKMTWPDGFYVTYSWDFAGDLTSITDGNASLALATFGYDNLGQRTSLARGNNVTTTYTMDGASRLTTLAQSPAGTWNFTYNPAGQIVTKAVPSAYASTGTTSNTAFSFNGKNQAVSSGALNLTYDDRGNLSSDGVIGYCYDTANRLISTNSQLSGCNPNYTQATLAYDPLGRLGQTTSSGGVTTKFVYDGVDLIGEYDGSGTLLRRYVHGPGTDEPLVRYEYQSPITPAGTTDRRWLLVDQLGSIVAETGGAGAVIASDTYDDYGVPGSSNQGRFQFTGQAWLSEVGLYYYKSRMYSPTLGQFMQADPIGYADGMNMYTYVHDDPINFGDPSGLSGCGGEAEWTENEKGQQEYSFTMNRCGIVLAAAMQSGHPSGGGGGGRGGVSGPDYSHVDKKKVCDALNDRDKETRDNLPPMSDPYNVDDVEWAMGTEETNLEALKYGTAVWGAVNVALIFTPEGAAEEGAATTAEFIGPRVVSTLSKLRKSRWSKLANMGVTAWGGARWVTTLEKLKALQNRDALLNSGCPIHG